MRQLYGFKRIFPGGVGETKDLRVQWALEETGLPYRVLALDQPAGDLDSELADRWLRDLERHLVDREWIACADFTVADILMASVLRSIQKTDLTAPYPRIQAYSERAHARPAWHRTLQLYAERFGVGVEEIR